MAATFTWWEHNGAGATPTGSRNECNWKNIDDSTTAYSSAPIVAGNNSYDKFQFASLSGTWNQILNVLYDHTAGAFGAGLTLFGSKTMGAAADRVTYRTPVTTADITNVVDISSANGSFPTGGKVLYLNKNTGPNVAGTASATNTGSDTAYTNYVYTQLRTTGSAGAGDTTQVTITLQYDEN